ncbi:MAG: hypothetical protein ACEQSK_11740 [Sphingomonadaceae bacterium]
MKSPLSAVLVPLAMLLSCLPALASDKLVLARPATKDSNYASRLFQLVATDAFSRLGYQVEVRNYPALRASREADAGRVDGEAGRSLQYGAVHPQLQLIDEAVVTIRMAAFVTDPAIKVNGWDSLQERPYRVSYRAGYELPRLRLQQMVGAARLHAVVEGQAGMQSLALGLTDVYIDTHEFGQMLIDKMPERYSQVRVAGWVEHLPLYFYLHRRHAALIPRLAAILKEMRVDGALERYLLQAYQEEARSIPR